MLHQSAALPGGTYDILIESGLLFRAGQVFTDILPRAERILLVTDENVAPLYAQTVLDSLSAAGYSVKTVVLPAGEGAKSPETVNTLHAEMFDFGIGKNDAAAVLGGGVLFDTVGVAAAMWLGGTALVCIPTTLTAQCDCAVGGSAGLNLPRGRGLVGTVHCPLCVISDPDCLMSLSARDFAAGMASVIRLSAACDAMLWDLLWRCGSRAGAMGRIEDIILACCRVKTRLCRSPELQGLPEYGQTLSDAIMTAYRYGHVPYGEALAMGMCRMNTVGQLLGITPPKVTGAVREMLLRYRLPVETALPQQALAREVLRRQQLTDNCLSLALLEDIGRVHTKQMTCEELLSLCME